MAYVSTNTDIVIPLPEASGCLAVIIIALVATFAWNQAEIKPLIAIGIQAPK